jgi:hypothetical protein
MCRTRVAIVFAWLATASNGLASPALDSGNYAYYKNPHTLSGIAHRFHLSVSQIATLNGIKDPEHFHAYGLKLPDTPATKSLPRYIPWEFAPPRDLCSAQRWKFTDVRKPGCEQTWCGNGSAGARACLCVLDVGARVELSWKDGSEATWDLPPSPFYSFGPDTLDVVSVDLDDDGAPETLVSWLTSTSNGIGEEFRTLLVFKSGREVIRYDSGAASASTAAVRINGRCHLTSSHYESAPEPLRGPAFYLVERTFDPNTMAMDRAIVGARVAETARFIIPFDPLRDVYGAAAASSGEIGTILGFEIDDALDEVTVAFDTPDPSRAQRFRRFRAPVRIGDAQTQRAFPQGLIAPSLIRNAVRIGRGSDHRPNILWLMR